MFARKNEAWLVQDGDQALHLAIRINQFDFVNSKWLPAELLSDRIDELAQVTAANGKLYLIGRKNKQYVLLVHNGKTWQYIDYLPLENAYGIDMLVDNNDIVIFARLKDRENLVFSTNHGKTWHEYAFTKTFEGLPRQALINGTYYRFGTVKGSIYYSLHYMSLHSAPFIMQQSEERSFPKDYRYFPYPKEASIGFDEKSFCFSRMVNSNGAMVPYAGCYDLTKRIWQTWFWNQIYGNIDVINDVHVLANNTMILMGSTKKDWTSTAYLYDGIHFTAHPLSGLSYHKFSQDGLKADHKIHITDKTIIAY